jgi:hypothetical protein
MAIPVVYVFNNAAVRSACGVCTQIFKPYIGRHPFRSYSGVPDYGAPVCDECLDKVDEEKMAPEVEAEQEKYKEIWGDWY